MTDHDLTQIGIEAFGARRRMQQAIAGTLSHSSFQPHFKENLHIKYFFSLFDLDHALASINRY